MVEESSIYYQDHSKMFVDIAELWNIVERYDNLIHIDYSHKFISNYYFNAGVNLTEDVLLVRRKNGSLSAFGTLFFIREDSSLKARFSIMVHPFYRGQGIGEGLLNLLMKKAEKFGCTEISCIIPDFRIYSIKFVEKFGFRKSCSRIKMRLDRIEQVGCEKKPSKLILRNIDVNREIGIWTSLQNEIFRDVSTYTVVTNESLRRMIQHPNFNNDLVIIGEVDNVKIGYCVGFLFNPSDYSSDAVIRILALGVLSDFRRKGYGKALLCEVLRRGMDMGYSISELLVGDSNIPAQHLYHELGFRKKYELLEYRLVL